MKRSFSFISFRYISIALNLSYNKSKLYKTLDYWSRDMLNFSFSEKGLGLVSPPHFVHDFPRKMFHMLHSIDHSILIDQISLYDCLHFSRSWQYVYYNYFLARLWRHKIWNQPNFSYQVVLLHGQKSQDKNLNILRKKTAFEVK